MGQTFAVRLEYMAVMVFALVVTVAVYQQEGCTLVLAGELFEKSASVHAVSSQSPLADCNQFLDARGKPTLEEHGVCRAMAVMLCWLTRLGY